MTVEVKRIPHASAGAPTDDRDELLEWPEESVDEGTPEEIEAAWIAEVKRRIAHVKRGKAILISSETARQMRTEIFDRARSRRVG